MVLSALLERTGVEPGEVVALDDRIHHVHSFVEALLTLKIKGRVIHYLKALEEPFNAEVAEIQLSHFKRKREFLSDEEAVHPRCARKLARRR
jgi:hypothetical protein